jgi:hypothetical protein
LLLPAPPPTRDEQLHRHLVHVLGEIDGRVHDLTPRLGKIRRARRGDGGRDVGAEGLAVFAGDERAALRVGHRDEVPRLTIAAARRERPRFAHFADQGHRHGIGQQAPDRACGANAFEERNLLANACDIDFVHERGMIVHNHMARSMQEHRNTTRAGSVP